MKIQIETLATVYGDLALLLHLDITSSYIIVNSQGDGAVVLDRGAIFVRSIAIGGQAKATACHGNVYAVTYNDHGKSHTTPEHGIRVFDLDTG